MISRAIAGVALLAMCCIAAPTKAAQSDSLWNGCRSSMMYVLETGTAGDGGGYPAGAAVHVFIAMGFSDDSRRDAQIAITTTTGTHLVTITDIEPSRDGLDAPYSFISTASPSQSWLGRVESARIVKIIRGASVTTCGGAQATRPRVVSAGLKVENPSLILQSGLPAHYWHVTTGHAAPKNPTRATHTTPRPHATSGPRDDCNREGSASISATPDYPESANDQGLGAQEVLIMVSLDASGSVAAASIYKSSGRPDFDRAAIAAARASTYLPKMKNCKGVPGQYMFRADFNPN